MRKLSQHIHAHFDTVSNVVEYILLKYMPCAMLPEVGPFVRMNSGLVLMLSFLHHLEKVCGGVKNKTVFAGKIIAQTLESCVPKRYLFPCFCVVCGKLGAPAFYRVFMYSVQWFHDGFSPCVRFRFSPDTPRICGVLLV